jgi:hypothetical protein
LEGEQAETFPVVQVAEIPREESRPRWLIEGLWGASAVGLIGGHPKLGKTFLALDMAVSVASGTACLGSYRVLDPGRVVVYLAEDPLADLRQRTEALAKLRGLVLRDLDLHALAIRRLRLDSESHRARLLRTIERLRPRILVLDPLVRLHSRDENDSAEIAELLSYLRGLQRTFDMAVVVVHHARKAGAPQDQAGQGLRGSGDLWAWLDSGLYLRRSGGHIVLSMEHRARAAPEPVFLRLVEKDEGAHLEVVPGCHPGEPVEASANISEAVCAALRDGGQLTRQQLRSRLAVKNERLGDALEALKRAGQIERTQQGWQVRKLR